MIMQQLPKRKFDYFCLRMPDIFAYDTNTVIVMCGEIPILFRNSCKQVELYLMGSRVLTKVATSLQCENNIEIIDLYLIVKNERSLTLTGKHYVKVFHKF